MLIFLANSSRDFWKFQIILLRISLKVRLNYSSWIIINIFRISFLWKIIIILASSNWRSGINILIKCSVLQSSSFMSIIDIFLIWLTSWVWSLSYICRISSVWFNLKIFVRLNFFLNVIVILLSSLDLIIDFPHELFYCLLNIFSLICIWSIWTIITHLGLWVALILKPTLRSSRIKPFISRWNFKCVVIIGVIFWIISIAIWILLILHIH